MPKIGIIGRRNVGKSTLFNALLKSRESITYDKPGVTRDLIRREANWGEGRWELTDFPGFEKLNEIDNELEKGAVEKAIRDLREYHLLLWVVSREGLTPYEHELRKLLVRGETPIWVIVNFVDDPSLEAEAAEMAQLGFENIFMVSGLNGRGIKTLREKLIRYFSGPSEKKEPAGVLPLISIVGKPNAGKSTLFNFLTRKELALVSDVPGTTRDSLSWPVSVEGVRVRLSDTAGLRKRKTIRDDVEFFSVTRTKRELHNSDGAIFLLDPKESFDRQNRNIIQMIMQEQKPAVLGITKADLYPEDSAEREEVRNKIRLIQKQYWELPYFFISGTDGRNTGKMMRKLITLIEKIRQPIRTSTLNQIIASFRNAPVLQSHRLKLKYITHATGETRFILFTNHRKIPDNIKKFIQTKIAEAIGWKDIPILIEYRISKGEREK